jgi:hypothetical protein
MKASTIRRSELGSLLHRLVQLKTRLVEMLILEEVIVCRFQEVGMGSPHEATNGYN